jgi:hypothetical protein
MKLLSLAILFLSLTAIAQEDISTSNEVTTHVIHMEEGLTNRDNTDVLVSWDGRVLEVDPSNTELVNTLHFASKEGLEVKLNIDKGAAFDILNKKEMIYGATVINENGGTVKHNKKSIHPMSGFIPTNVDGQEKAQEIFDSLNDKTKRRSQCFNRAHIWSKSMWDNYKIKSMKIFIFYTKKFREEVSDKWWFHVAPMINVNGELMVMDREFTRTPKTAEQWERIFTKKMNNPGYRCIKMDNISTYYENNNYYNEFCNIEYSSMYHWGPNDLKRAAKTGEIQTSWKDWKIKTASKQGFKKWRKVYSERTIVE